MQERVGIGAITDGEFPKAAGANSSTSNATALPRRPSAVFPFTQFDGTTIDGHGEPR